MFFRFSDLLLEILGSHSHVIGMHCNERETCLYKHLLNGKIGSMRNVLFYSQ